MRRAQLQSLILCEMCNLSKSTDSSNQAMDPIARIFPFDDHLKCIRCVWETLDRFKKDQSCVSSQLLNSKKDNHITITLELLWQIQRYESLIGRMSRALDRYQNKIKRTSVHSDLSSSQKNPMNQTKQMRRILLAQLTVMWMRIHCLQVLQTNLNSIGLYPCDLSDSLQPIFNLYFGLSPSDYQRITPGSYLSRLLVTPSGAVAYIQAAEAFRKIWNSFIQKPQTTYDRPTPIKIQADLMVQVADLAQNLGILRANPSNSTLIELTNLCMDSLIRQTMDWAHYAYQEAAKLAKQVSLLKSQPSNFHPVHLHKSPVSAASLNNPLNSEHYEHQLTAPIWFNPNQHQSAFPPTDRTPEKTLTDTINLQLEPNLGLDLHPPLKDKPPEESESTTVEASVNAVASTNFESTSPVVNLDNQQQQIAHPNDHESLVSPQIILEPNQLPLSLGQENNSLIQELSQSDQRRDNNQAHLKPVSLSPEKSEHARSSQSNSLSTQDSPRSSTDHDNMGKSPASKLLDHSSSLTESPHVQNIGVLSTNHETLTSKEESLPIHQSPSSHSGRMNCFETLSSPCKELYSTNHGHTSSPNERHNIHHSLMSSQQRDDSSEQGSLPSQPKEAHSPTHPESLFSPQNIQHIPTSMSTSEEKAHPNYQESLSSPEQEINPNELNCLPTGKSIPSTQKAVLPQQNDFSNNQGFRSSQQKHHHTTSFPRIPVAEIPPSSNLEAEHYLQQASNDIHPHETRDTVPEHETNNPSQKMRYSMGPQYIVNDAERVKKDSTSNIAKRRCGSTNVFTQPDQKRVKLTSVDGSEKVPVKVIEKVIDQFLKNPRLSGAFQQAKEKAIVRSSHINSKQIHSDEEAVKSNHSEQRNLLLHDDPYSDSVLENQNDLVEDEGSVNPGLDSIILQKLKDGAAKFSTEKSYFANMMNHFFGQK